MPSALSQEKVECVKVKLALGLPADVIAQQTNVSLRSVYRICRNIVLNGTPRAPKVVHQGRPRRITPEMEEVWPYKSIFGG